MDKKYEPKEYTLKELGGKSGIYQIRNLINNKIYVGSSKNIQIRFYNHRSKLKNNKHNNTYLQNSYNKYGKENFVYEIIEFCKEYKKIELEQYWIDRLGVVDKNIGYNISKKANMPEVKTTKVICLNTMEVFDSIEKASKKLNICKGCITKLCQGVYANIKGFKIMYYNDYIENKDNIVEIFMNRERNTTCKKIYCIELKKVFNSVKEAKKELKVSNITAVLRGRQITTGGYHFIYYEDYCKYDSNKLKDIKNTKGHCDGTPIRVKCVNNNMIFNSYTDASLYFNINRKTVSRSCENKKPTRNGLMFEKVNF